MSNRHQIIRIAAEETGVNTGTFTGTISSDPKCAQIGLRWESIETFRSGKFLDTLYGSKNQDAT